MVHTRASKTRAFQIAKVRELDEEAHINQMMSFGHRSSSSSPPAHSSSTKAASHGTSQSSAQLVLLQQDSSQLEKQEDESLEGIFDETECGTLPGRVEDWVDSVNLVISTPEAEEFYRFSTAHEEEMKGLEVVQRPLTPYPRFSTSRCFNTVPSMVSKRRPAMKDGLPSSKQLRRSETEESQRSTDTYKQTIQPQATPPRPPTPFPQLRTSRQYATVPAIPSNKQIPITKILPYNLSRTHPSPRRKQKTYPPRLPSDYRASTPFSYQTPITPTPFASFPHHSITPSDPYYHAGRIGGVELELESLEHALEPGKVVRRPVWPEERREVLREGVGMAVGSVSGKALDDFTVEGESGQEMEAEGEREEKKKKKKRRFGWLMKWKLFKKKPPG
jgi:hypothetical protein